MQYGIEEVSATDLGPEHIGRIIEHEYAGTAWWQILGIAPAGDSAWVHTAHRNPIYIEPGGAARLLVIPGR
ncbi:hypothetical protein [Nocardia wallacei]|uniref:hypothetical protein n=1 Tax=Nocardia wallacei TaxID=480035 RepID=UPI0024542439|nr:hypothetical protein [Nocardia wallacei]